MNRGGRMRSRGRERGRGRGRCCKMMEGFEGEARPVAASDLGDGEEGTPVVGQAIEGGGGEGWLARFERGEVIGGPAGELPAELGFDFDVVVVEASGYLVGLG